jgi:putative transcriptional regulator
MQIRRNDGNWMAGLRPACRQDAGGPSHVRSAGILPAWRAILLCFAALFAAMLIAAADPAPIPDPPAGQLLIASEAIKDRRFFHSVILLIGHDRKGAFGIAINRPLGERSLSELLAATSGDGDEQDRAAAGTIRVFAGGPVQREFGFVVHSAEYRRPDTRAVGDALAMTANKDVLRDIGRGTGPAKYLFALGYAGWSAGQLEGEIARRDWFTAPADPDLVFDLDRDAVWERAMARRMREL